MLMDNLLTFTETIKPMKKQYIIESKGFREGVGSSKYLQKQRNEIMELEAKIKELEKLEELRDDYNWYTVLIDFTYHSVEVFEGSGLNESRDLGEDSDEWYSESEDLFSYREMEGDSIFHLINSNDFRLC
jgi:hypothetical protein